MPLKARRTRPGGENHDNNNNKKLKHKHKQVNDQNHNLNKNKFLVRQRMTLAARGDQRPTHQGEE